MNRLRILLITSALIAGSSALASAQEPYKAGFAVQVRLGGNEGNKGGFFYAHGDGDDHSSFYFRGDRDRDRDDRYVDRDDDRHFDRYDRYRHNDRDDRWRWKRDDDRRSRDFDHDGDRR